MIISINDEYRIKVNKIVKEEWAGPIVITKGISHDTSNYNGFVSIENDELLGYILYDIREDKCEIIVLQSLLENHGIGTELINTVINVAKENNCKCVWLITTNDNMHAIRYYQKFGFELNSVYINALDISRKMKPSIPLIGNDEIPLKHEFEFTITL